MSSVRPKGWQIKKLRAERDLTQEELAVEAGYSKRWIEELERGTPCDIFALQVVADALAVAVDGLIREPASGEGVLGQEWHLDRKRPQGRPQVAANGLRYEVFRIPSRHLPDRSARAKLYDTTKVASETEKRAKALLGRHSLVCHRLKDAPCFARHITSAADEQHGFWWVLDEWTDGRSLDSLLKTGIELSLWCRFARQLAEALGLLHREGIVRRELTPKSVVVRNSDNGIVLTDFETGKLLEGVPTVSPKDRWRNTVYLAPEVVAGAEIGTEADWFSWGTIFLRALQNEIPRTHKQRCEIIDASRLPANLRKTVKNCISLDASLRPRDARSILKHMERL